MTIKPLAYAAVSADGSESVYVAILKEQAEACCRESGWFLVPLYAAPPTWQDEEAAVEAAFERSGVQPTWPDDEAGNVGPMAEAMADEIERLRLALPNVGPAPVERQRSASVADVGGAGLTLTEEEREAIYRAEARLRTAYVPDDKTAATLRKLLERLK
jgi:hypothetical protein